MSVWEALGELDRSQPRMGEQLICALRDAIEQGTLVPGTRLPSTRDLAADLRVSRGLVVSVYERLIAEGRLTAKRGSGTVVTRRAEPIESTASPYAPGTCPVSVTLLRPDPPDLGLFPRTAWRRAYERAVTVAADADFDVSDPAGAFRLRAELAAYLTRIRAARVDVDRLVVTAGASQAIALVGVAIGAGRVGVEDPGNPEASARLAACGATVVPVPVDRDGIDVTAVRDLNLSAVLVTPAHQYPTGVVLAPDRRTALLDWARSTDALIIEDDYDAEFRFDREPVGCLQGLAPEQVLLVGSVSRTLAPALRLGWIVAPRRWQEPLRMAKRLADGGGPTLDQLAFAELLASTGYDRHLRRARRALKERRDALVTAVRVRLSPLRVLGVPGGLHVTAELPGDVDDVALVELASGAGLRPVALSSLRCRAGGPPGLVLGYGAHPRSELVRAVDILSDLLR